jgi:hypothetical protein
LRASAFTHCRHKRSVGEVGEFLVDNGCLGDARASSEAWRGGALLLGAGSGGGKPQTVLSTLPAADSEAWGLALGSDGKLVLAGGVGVRAFALMYFDSDGLLDTSFSGDGLVRTRVPDEFEANAWDVEVQAEEAPSNPVMSVGDRPGSVHGKEDPMSKLKRLGALLFAVFTLAAAVAPAALGDAPGPGDKPQCAGGPSNNNPHCPQNK